MSSQGSIDNMRLLVEEQVEEFAILDRIFNSEEINERVKLTVAALKHKFQSLKIVHASFIQMSREEIKAQALQIDSLKEIQENLQEDIHSGRKYINELLERIAQDKIQMKGTMGNESLWNEFEEINRVNSRNKQELTVKLAMLQDYHVYTANLQQRNSYLEGQVALLLNQLRDANEEKLEYKSQVDSLVLRQNELFQEICRNSNLLSLAQSQQQPSAPTPSTDLANRDSIESIPSTATIEPPVVRRRIETPSSNETPVLKVVGAAKRKTLKYGKSSYKKSLKSIDEEKQKVCSQIEEVQSKLKTAEEMLNRSLRNESIMQTIADGLNATIKEYKAIMIRCAEHLALSQSIMDQTQMSAKVGGTLFYDILTNVRMTLIDIARDEQDPLAIEPASNTMSKLVAKYDNDVPMDLQTRKSKRKSIKYCENCVRLTKRINDLEAEARIGTDKTLESYRTHCEYLTTRINALQQEKEERAAEQAPSQNMIDLQNDYAALLTKYSRMETIARMRWTEIQELNSRLGYDPAQGPSTE